MCHFFPYTRIPGQYSPCTDRVTFKSIATVRLSYVSAAERPGLNLGIAYYKISIYGISKWCSVYHQSQYE